MKLGNWRNILDSKWVWLVLVVGVAGLAHWWNMFHFPYFENDEGVYVSQAWAVTQGKLAPYTYTYDHAPAGWILIAWWQMMVGVFGFGTSVNTGRVLMLILQMVSTGLLFLITRKTTGKTLAAVVAGLVFGLSPLAVYFHRRVLLDNILVFWTLLAVWILLRRKVTLWMMLVSGVIMGIAVLTKEVGVAFVPGILYLIWMKSEKNTRFTLSLWLTAFGLVVGSYAMYALLKGELFPASWVGGPERVSLVGTLFDQLGRGVGVPFWKEESLFYNNWIRWIDRDPVIIWFGIGSLIAVVIGSLNKIEWREMAILGLCFLGLLLRSKLVIDFYILPLIPFMAWAMGAVLGETAEIFSSIPRAKRVWSIGVVGVLVISFMSNDIGLYHRDETSAQIQTIEYLKRRAVPEANIAADSALFLDLKLSRYSGDPALVHTDWAWKVARDPAVYGKKLGGDWRNLDYVVVSHEVFKQVREFDAKFLQEALENSRREVIFNKGSVSYVDFPKFISTNGDWMAVDKVKDRDDIVLDRAWEFYKQDFIVSYGRVVDPQTGRTTSEGQSYAMLRAVWMNDKKTFDGVWQWTRDVLQYRQDDKLFSWVAEDRDGRVQVTDFATASDGDIDIATALLMAYGRWGDEGYVDQAREIIQDIWRKEVVAIGGRYYLTAGSDLKRGDGYVLNPSYWSPAAYRMFAEVDTEHPWLNLVVDTYGALDRVNDWSEVPPNWVWIHERTGELRNANPEMGISADKYGYDAFRIYFRVSEDVVWYDSEAGRSYLESWVPFWRDQWQEQRGWPAEYNLFGVPVVDYEGLATSVGPMSVMMAGDEAIAESVFARYYAQDDLRLLTGYWGSRDNYYDQNWAWFGYGWYTGRLENWWELRK